MNKINILTSDIYNQISAGEVVERPQSVVKELVENAIDAGSSRVNINIDGGGIDLIEVSDNGCGIAEEDIQTAFLPHATSKIYNTSQLFNIQTLGFRGEALASISSVSDVTITSRTPTAEMATKANLKEGEIVDSTYCSYNVGTKIQVRDLFYNVPARRKFLKSTSRETTVITQYVARLILTNPYLEVNYMSDGQYIYRSSGNGIEEAISAIYGSDCLSNCIPINSTHKGITVTGYIGTPEFAKANSTYQTVSVNGRYIRDAIITSAAKQAYLPYLMTRSYGFYILNIDIDNSEVDVNVHPAKMEVRFADSKKVFVAVAYPIKEALKRFSENRVQRLFEVNHIEDNQTQLSIGDMEPVINRTDEVFVPLDDKFFSRYNLYTDNMQLDSTDYDQLTRNGEEAQREYLQNFDKIARKLLQEGDSFENSVFSPPPTYNQVIEKTLIDNAVSNEVKFEYDYSKVRIIGSLFHTYLMLELDDKFILVDQHAAHERILFDRYMAQSNNLPIQPLMIPYVFTVQPEEADYLNDNLSIFTEGGFEIEHFGGNSFRIVAVASLFAHCNFDKFINKILYDIENEHLSTNQMLKDAIAREACKHAVKGGKILVDAEIQYIIKCIFDNKQLQCPHGRPVTIEFTSDQLKKLFKRIV